MVNLAALAVMIGLGIWFGLSASYYVLIVIGSLLGITAGFASFSRGAYFAGGRGDAIGGILNVVNIIAAVAIGWFHGFWWGLAALFLFWPIMFRLGAQLFVWGLQHPPNGE